MKMNQRDMVAFKAAERDYLAEPEEDFEPKRCACCEGIPDDGKLYNHDGQWLCMECLIEDIPCRDAYNMKDW
jgi:hypothetical protein